MNLTPVSVLFDIVPFFSSMGFLTPPILCGWECN